MSPGPTLIHVRSGATAASVTAQIRECGASRWLLVGHGTAGAVASQVAVEVLAGRLPVFGLAGVVLAAGCTPAESALAESTDAFGVEVPLLLTDATDSDDLEAAVAEFWAVHAGRGPIVPEDMVALLASNRVSARTRGIHARRVLADDPAYVPSVLDAAGLDLLRLVADRVVPQDGDPSTWIDLAARVDAQLAAGIGDGWRTAGMPPDPDAYRAATGALAPLADLDPAGRDRVLTQVAAGDHTAPGPLDARQLAVWFEDARVDLVRQWLAHPATMSRVGYDGFANGGDGERKQGFVELTLGAREAWEPVMAR